MSVVPASIIDPIREEFLRLLPVRPDSHTLGCHNPRIADAVVFDRLVLALVSGMGYERVADRACSATTIRRRPDSRALSGSRRTALVRLVPACSGFLTVHRSALRLLGDGHDSQRSPAREFLLRWVIGPGPLAGNPSTATGCPG
ncbi:hypothetical protein GA0115259_107464 [Streptomyces sp. MnatMP-M17]|nr:hypothetical protein GA0115259_107464 [Streptomyces sp. MnatMP-M17]